MAPRPEVIMLGRCLELYDRFCAGRRRTHLILQQFISKHHIIPRRTQHLTELRSASLSDRSVTRDWDCKLAHPWHNPHALRTTFSFRSLALEASAHLR